MRVVVVVVVTGCGFPTTWCLGLRHRKSKHSWDKEEQQQDTVKAPQPGTLMHRIALLSAAPVYTACMARSSYSHLAVVLPCQSTVQARPCSTTNTSRRASPDHQVTSQCERINKGFAKLGSRPHPTTATQREAHGYTTTSNLRRTHAKARPTKGTVHGNSTASTCGVRLHQHGKPPQAMEHSCLIRHLQVSGSYTSK